MVEDPDYIGHGEEARPLDVKELLVKANLIMELPRGVELGATVGSPFDPPPIDREMGMGGYAWQVPAYKELLRRALR